MSDPQSTLSTEKTLASGSSYDQDDQSKKYIQSRDQSELDDGCRGHGEEEDDEEGASAERPFSIVSFSLHRRPSVDSAFTVPTIRGGGSKTRAASVALTTSSDAKSVQSYDCKQDRLEAADSDLEDVYPDGGLQAWIMVLGVRDISRLSLRRVSLLATREC